MIKSDLLGKTFDCECGRRHTVPTEHYIYSGDAIERLSAIVRAYVSDPDYLIIADERTYGIAGSMIEKTMQNDGATVGHFIVPDRNGDSPKTDDGTKDHILKEAPDAGAYIAAGSGVINDLTKWIACEKNKPFFTVATAASMNGYSSANVAALINGLKLLVHAQACKGVFAIPEIIERTPFELTAAGLGDVVAKPVSSADWRLNHVLFDEYYCQLSIDLLKDLEPIYLEHPEKIKERNPDAIQTLFEALFYSGIAMTITGTSAPAAGAEHLISHTIDMISILRGDKHDLHGRQVGLGSILSAALYEKVLGVESPELRKTPPEVDKAFWGPLTDTVLAEYKKKIHKFELSAKMLSHPNNWDHLRSILKQNLIPPESIKHCLRQAGAAYRIRDIRINDVSMESEAFITIFKNANQMREKFTVLDLAIILGIMPEKIEDILFEWVMD